MRIKAMKSHLIAMLIAVLGLAALRAGPAQAADITLRKAPAASRAKRTSSRGGAPVCSFMCFIR